MTSNWQPIETAPKDGTRVRLWQPGNPGWSEDGYFYKWKRLEEWRSVRAIPHAGRGPSGSGEQAETVWKPQVLTPTHWQPLPAPPRRDPGGAG